MRTFILFSFCVLLLSTCTQSPHQSNSDNKQSLQDDGMAAAPKRAKKSVEYDSIENLWEEGKFMGVKVSLDNIIECEYKKAFITRDTLCIVIDITDVLRDEKEETIFGDAFKDKTEKVLLEEYKGYRSRLTVKRELIGHQDGEDYELPFYLFQKGKDSIMYDKNKTEEGEEWTFAFVAAKYDSSSKNKNARQIFKVADKIGIKNLIERCDGIHYISLFFLVKIYTEYSLPYFISYKINVSGIESCSVTTESVNLRIYEKNFWDPFDADYFDYFLDPNFKYEEEQSESEYDEEV